MEFVASFSGGKDSAIAIKRMISLGHRLVAIVVSAKKDENKSWTHNISMSYFEKIADIMRCELIKVSTDVENYEKNFEEALMKAKKIGAEACIFGDIDITSHLKWNKDRCKNACIECIHPLMFEERESICQEFINSKMKAKIVKVNKEIISEKFIGQYFDNDFLNEIEKLQNVDKCGENGEFHTIVESSSMREEFFNYVYVDNASTCFPKAPGVGTELSLFTDHRSFSLNRGTYVKAYNLSSEIIDVREKVLKIVDAPRKYHCIFTPSATESINLILRGILRCGDEIIVDNRIHNSTWRTLEYLRQNDVEILMIDSIKNSVKNIIGVPNKDICSNRNIQLSKNSLVDDITKAINSKTRAIMMTMVDNITGKYLKEIGEIGKVCKKNDIYFIVDAVQGFCEREFSVKDIFADALIITSHIGAMGPEGISAVIMSDKLARDTKAFIYGGTGSKSNSPLMPSSIPDKFEAGTLNSPGIVGFGKALNFINIIGINNIILKKHKLGEMLRKRLSEINGVEVSGEGSFCSISIKEEDDAIIAFNLDIISNIMTRVGIHCSPCTHIAEGSFPNGSIRFSLGYFNNEDDIKYIAKSLKKEINKNI